MLRDGTETAADGMEGYEGLMLAEYSHPMANDMTMIIAELELCRARALDGPTSRLLSQAVDRMQNICSVQRCLTQRDEETVDLAGELGDLAEAVVRARSGLFRVDLVLRMEPLEVSSYFAWRLATMAAELLTNALKHGLSARGGRIFLSLQHDDETLCCTVGDDGPGAGDWRSEGSGLGYRIIEAIAEDLGGTVGRQTSTQGTEVRLIFPVTAAALSASGSSDASPPHDA